MTENQKKITLEIALLAAKQVINYAKRDGGEPIAVTIVGINPNVEIVKLSMEGVLPISSRLSWQKAYTAIMTKQNTKYWAEWQAKGKEIGNFCDSNITAFAGGILILDPETKEIIGAIGVSGRKGYITAADELKQDHELAELGALYLEDLLVASLKTAH